MTDLFLYLISHDRKDIKTHTYIGCVEDFVNRLQQHNGIIAGGPRITRRAAGSWSPVIILKLPQHRTFDAKKLKKEWKQSSRGLESRIKKGFALAIKYNYSATTERQGDIESAFIDVQKGYVFFAPRRFWTTGTVLSHSH